MLVVCNAECSKTAFCQATQHWRLWVQPGEALKSLWSVMKLVLPHFTSFIGRAIFSTGIRLREPTIFSTTLSSQPGEERRSDSITKDIQCHIFLQLQLHFLFAFASQPGEGRMYDSVSEYFTVSHFLGTSTALFVCLMEGGLIQPGTGSAWISAYTIRSNIYVLTSHR